MAADLYQYTDTYRHTNSNGDKYSDGVTNSYQYSCANRYTYSNAHCESMPKCCLCG